MVSAGQGSIFEVGLIPKAHRFATPADKRVLDGGDDIVLVDLHAQAEVVANHGAGRDIEQHNDPEPVDQAWVPAAIERGNHDDKSAVEFVGIHLDALKRVVDRAVDTGARDHLFLQLGATHNPGRLDGVGAQHRVSVAAQSRVTHGFHGERPLVAGFKPKTAQLLEKPCP